MAFLDEIKDRLVAQGVGVYGTSIFLGAKAVIPAGAGPYLTLVDTGGSGSVKTHNNSSIERPTAQLCARATDYATAKAFLIAALAALGGQSGLFNVLLGTTWYLSITARQNPTDIGLDEAGRAMLVVNIDAEKQPS